jgi:hydrogenase maturation factor
MKKEINFDHDAKSLADALGIEPHAFASQLAAVMAIYDAVNETKVSKLSALVHSCIDYKIILMMATTQLVGVVERFNNSNDIDELFGTLSQN